MILKWVCACCGVLNVKKSSSLRLRTEVIKWKVRCLACHSWYELTVRMRLLEGDDDA